MEKLLGLLMLSIIFPAILFSQNKKFRILNEYGNVIDCKVEMQSYLGNVRYIRYNDKKGFVDLPTCSDTVNINIIPNAFADYDNLTFHRCSDIPTIVKITYKTSNRTLSLAAEYYSSHKEYGKSVLLFNELSYRQSFINKDSSMSFEINAIENAAKALNYHGNTYIVSKETIQLTNDFKLYLNKFQKQYNLKKTNSITHEIAQKLADKNLIGLIAEFNHIKIDQIVLGLPTLGKSSTITDANSDELSGAVQDQVGKIKSLKLVLRNSDAMKAISSELSKTNDPSALNADVLAAGDKQSGATYLLIGTISKIDLTKTFIKYQRVLDVDVPVYAKFVNIQTSVAILDVSTGVYDTTAQINSDMVPVEADGGNSRTYSIAFKLLAIKVQDFVQTWYKNKIGL